MSDFLALSPTLSDLVATWPLHQGITEAERTAILELHLDLDRSLLADSASASQLLGECEQRAEGLNRPVTPSASDQAVPLHSYLHKQIAAARVFIENSGFATPGDRQTFLEDFAIPRAELLGVLHGYGKAWHRQRLHELGRGTLLLHTLLLHPAYARVGRAALPLSQLESQGLTLNDLIQSPDEPLKRVLWRVSVRGRDAFAQGRDFVDDLPRTQARDFKRWWMQCIFLIADLEKRDYDVSQGPTVLTRFQHLHIRWLTLFGKSAFK